MDLHYELFNSIQQDLSGVSKDMPITSDLSIAQARSVILLGSIFKKFEDKKSSRADALAVETFIRMNEHCESFNLSVESEFDATILGEVRQTFWEIFSNMSQHQINYSVDEILNEGGLGPGANIGAESYNFYTKMYDSDLSHTHPKLLRMYKSWCNRRTPTVYHAENTREDNRGSRLVEASNLSTVPKNVDISRTICTEPTLNMYYQKGLGKILEQVLQTRFNINLATQPELNRKMARIGSINGKFSTIDLKSASDTIALSMIESICPKEFFELLQLIRSPAVRLPGGRVIPLMMISTMGNGFTFPLQTMLFATIVKAVYKIAGFNTSDHAGPLFSVFGDDIVVIPQCYHLVLRALRLFGFIVNDDKSFNTGAFRESCGHDYINGIFVRGYYCKSLKTQANINATYNGLYVWQLATGIILPNTTRLLKKHTSSVVPMYESAEAGRYTVNPPKNYVILRPQSRSFKFNRLPYRQCFNADGFIRAFVGGYITAYTVTLRSAKVSYQRVKRRYLGGNIFVPVFNNGILSVERLHKQVDIDDYIVIGEMLDNI